MQFYIFRQQNYDISNAVSKLKTIEINPIIRTANLQAVSSLHKDKIDIALVIADEKTTISTIKTLRPHHLNSTIICVCDKNDPVELFISKGANDYIFYESLDTDRFLVRAQIWLGLSNLRKNENLWLTDGKNAFGIGVWDRRVRFSIQNEYSLELLWEYFLNDKRFDQIKHAASWVQACYSMCLNLLNKKIKHTVTFEENEQYFFLTITDIDSDTDKDIAQELISYSGIEKLRFVGHIYKKAKGLLSIHLRKKTPISASKEVEFSTQEKQNKTTNTKSYPTTGLLIDKASDYIKESQINKDDLMELKELEKDLRDAIECAKDNNESLKAYGRFFANYSLAISQLMEFEELKNAIQELGQVVLENDQPAMCDKILYFADSVREDLSLWFNHVFILQDAQNIHYLDASLMSNCDHIKCIITGQASDSGEEFELF